MRQICSSPTAAIERFWDKYIKYIVDHGVNQSISRWYVIRTEQYIKAFPDKKLADHSPNDVISYFEKLGKSDRIQDWQFRQTIDAIQNLFNMLDASWLSEVDWQHWLDSSASLKETHPTIAREIPAEKTIRQLANQQKSALTEARKLYGDVLKQLLIEIRQRGYSIRTEQAYEPWVSRFIAYCNNRNPLELGGQDVVSFMQHLAVRRNVAISTQRQALNALVFFYDNVVKKPLGDLGNFLRSKRPKKMPIVLTRAEVTQILEQMKGKQQLMASLLYGTGMRLMDCIRLRVQDVDFEYRQIMIRNGKGKKDRVVPLPERLLHALQSHLEEVKELYQQDLRNNVGGVYLPEALGRKYTNASKEWGWQYVFPSARLSVDPRSNKTRRHHIHENGLQKAVNKAGKLANLVKRVNCSNSQRWLELDKNRP